jgi:signal transduction histidine kinase
MGPLRVDLVLAGVALVTGIAEVVARPDAFHHLGLSIAASAGVAAAVAFRRRRPLEAVLAFYGLLLAQQLLGGGLTQQDGPVMPFIALLLMNYGIGAYLGGRALAAGVISAALGLVLMMALPGSGPSGPSDYFFVLFVLVAPPVLVGRAVRERLRLLRALQIKNAELEREREERARAAVRSERARIARELHDVVAHSLSVMVVQAGAARRVIDVDHAGAAESFQAIQGAGREALGEVRRLLGMLREDGDEPAVTPQPRLENVGALVERTRAAGLHVDLEVEGTPVSLPAGVELAAYRILQEALTNTIKHAGPSHARVRVHYGEGGLELEVVDDGRGAGGQNGGGHGLTGMRERVALYGGELTAGARPTGGFAVRARIPTPGAAR